MMAPERHIMADRISRYIRCGVVALCVIVLAGLMRHGAPLPDLHRSLDTDRSGQLDFFDVAASMRAEASPSFVRFHVDLVESAGDTIRHAGRPAPEVSSRVPVSAVVVNDRERSAPADLPDSHDNWTSGHISPAWWCVETSHDLWAGKGWWSRGPPVTA
ncbi:MAG: hypothetical protein Tsb0013_03380 [Phycisphaerales bacterium]